MLQLAIIAYLVFEIQRLYNLPVAECNTSSLSTGLKSAQSQGEPVA